jgi:8-oxo-dGTP pyrophosphatase MutT (NUDIX family)
MDARPETNAFEAFAQALVRQLDAPLPGHAAHRQMAPLHPPRQQALSVSERDCREAGVLALVFPDDGATRLVLTVRRETLSDHAGQISFPGGQREGDELLSDTALREAHEEVNLPPETVTLHGALTPLYIPPSGFCVHPFVGTVDHAPRLRPTDAEVGTILRVPLGHLLHDQTRRREPWTLHGQEIEVPFFAVGEHKVWGATAMMLAELLAVVEALPADARPAALPDASV